MQPIVPSLRRHAPLLLVFAFLLAQLAGSAHLALERHVVCAEHGELIHAASTPLESEGVLPEGPRAEGEAPEEFHGHCGVVLHHRSCAWLTGDSTGLHPPPAEPTDRPTGPRASTIALLLRAPKQSPPA